VPAAQDRTLYLPIRLNATVPRQVGVFIPAGYQPGTTVDLVVYFHGHIISACKTREADFLAEGMEYYWSTPYFRCLREDLSASSAKAILIAPTFLPIFGSQSTPRKFGNLNEPGKLDFLIRETLARLSQDGAVPQGAQAGRIILSGHSAGGLPMVKILEARNELLPSIVECWGFECLYFGTSGWKTWLSSNPNKVFRHFRRASEFGSPSGALRPLANFVDVTDGADHCRMVEQKWREAIDQSGFFRGEVPTAGV
jgi:hypothetical protein